MTKPRRGPSILLLIWLAACVVGMVTALAMLFSEGPSLLVLIMLVVSVVGAVWGWTKRGTTDDDDLGRWGGR